MSIIVACECGKKFRAREEHTGKRAKCPACGRMLVIAAEATAKSGDSIVASSESDALRPSVAKPTESNKAQPLKPVKGGASQAANSIQPTATKPLRKYSLAGLIIAGILMVGAISGAFRGATTSDLMIVESPDGRWAWVESPEARESRLLRLFGGIAGSLALAVRSFLPRLTFWRGLLVLFGSLGYVLFLHTLALHGMGPPHVMLLSISLPGLALAFGFRTTETNAERRRIAVCEESNRAVEKARAQGHAAKVCHVCGGTGERGWMLVWRCGVCKGAGYLVSAAKSSSDR